MASKQLSIRIPDHLRRDITRLQELLHITEDGDLVKTIITALGKKTNEDVVSFLFLEHSQVQQPLPLYRGVSSLDSNAPVPILGSIPAGPLLPQEITRTAIGYMDATGLRSPKGGFCLKVTGESMTNGSWRGGGIRDGDYVVLAPVAPEVDGDVAAIVLQDGKTTLKRIYAEDGCLRLVPMNTEYEDMTVPTEELSAAYAVCDVIPADKAKFVTL